VGGEEVKYISICSGIEAASTAWHGLGWQPLAFSEIDAFPSAVLAERYPQVPNLGDMSKFHEWPEELLADCELLVGGTPCQAFSVAGLRKSLEDDRGNLSLVYVQLFHHINEIRRKHGRSPAIALWENVPGVLSTKDNAFGCFISGLLGVDDTIEVEGGKWPKAGFLGSETVRVGYRVLDAQYFAVAQRRRRVFLVAVPCELVASLGERACPSEILSLRESVLGNPPTRGEARQAVARGSAERAASGGEPYHLDRAMFNQGVNAQYDPQITDNGVASSMVARGPAAVAFKPSHYTRGKDGRPDEVAPPLSADADKGDQDTVIMRQSIGFNWQNGGGYGNANDGLGITEEGTGPLSRSQVPACVTGQRTHALTTRAAAVEEDGTGHGTPIVPVDGEPQTFDWQASDGGQDKSFRGGSRAYIVDKPGCSRSLTSCKTLAVAFSAKDSGSDATEECSPTMRAMQHVDGNANAGGQIAVAYGVDTYNQTVSDVSIPLRVGNAKDSLPAAMVPFTKAKRAQSTTDDESWVPGEVAPTQNQFDVGDTRATTVVAFRENTRSEVQYVDPPHALTSGGGKPGQGYCGVQTGMQVRRLTPTECCRLQGFPDDHCDIVYRKKPAADGPKYRALGNSMAVPCMAWLGWRIHKATRGDK
jgi:DNA (cytosine-5)-methyltransferase 1